MVVPHGVAHSVIHGLAAVSAPFLPVTMIPSCFDTYKVLGHKAHILRGGREQGWIDGKCGRVDALVTIEAKGVTLVRLRERLLLLLLLLLLLRHRRKHTVEIHVRCVKSESSALHCLEVFVCREGRLW
jgi:hypothetical protein